MGTFFHRLKRCETSERPRQYCFFDCEANRTDTPDGGEIQTLRLGVAEYQRLGRNNNPEINKVWVFRTPNEFWDQLLDHAEQDRPLVCVAYNVRYDIRIVAGFEQLKRLGFKQRSLYYKGESTVLVFKRGNLKLVIIDAMNYVGGRLAYWGDVLGLPKLDIEFDTENEASLIEYCKRDVEILKRVVWKWFDLIDAHEWGSFACTRAAQAFNAFRHRYMDTDIFIHADNRTTKLERASYGGGRTEAFYIGPLVGKRFYKLDVNSMYPYVMTKTKVPTKLLGTIHRPSIERLKRWVKSGCVTAEVTINTTEPCYPLKTGAKLLFPVGRFRTTLATPELNHAMRLGRVVDVHQASIYEGEVIFKRYVKDLYRIRKKYEAEGNPHFAKMVKIMMNSLYGKMAALTEKMTTSKNVLGDEDGEHYDIDGNTGGLSRYVVIAGQRWDFGETTEWLHSAVGIASHITSEARMLLWRIIKEAGRKRVYYCDTDSVITDAEGYHRLKSRIHDTRLGALGMESWSYDGEIRGLKDYSFGDENKIKGVRANAEMLRPGVYRQDQWQGLAGAIRDGVHDRVIITPMTKRLTRIYSKGSVSDSGWVSPLSAEAVTEAEEARIAALTARPS